MADVEYTPPAGVSYDRSGNRMDWDQAGGHHLGDHAQDDAHPGVGRAVTVAGAILSLAFMTGLGVWGYKLMMRDVSGVPVVRAIEGPMRVQPEDPGGRPADHQGLAVNAVAAVGEAAPTPDRLVLAPRPVSLTEEDMPLTALAQAEEERIQQASAEGPVEEDALADDESRPEELDEDAIAALVEELTQGVDPLGEVGDDLAALAPDVDWPEEPLEDEEGYIPEEDEESIEIPAEVIVAPGVSRSPRPLPRPAALTRPSTTPQTAAPAQPAPVAEVDADKVAPGTRLAQLGAFESEEVARSEWVKLAGRFGDYLDGKSRVVQKAASGGRTFYRLRAMGFEDLADARRFCSALVAEGADCIPVVTR